MPIEKRLAGHTCNNGSGFVNQGCMFVRVHDVKENVELLIQMMERIRKVGKNGTDFSTGLQVLGIMVYEQEKEGQTFLTSMMDTSSQITDGWQM